MWKPGILLPPLHNSLIGTRGCNCCITILDCVQCLDNPAPIQFMVVVDGFSMTMPDGCLNCDVLNHTWFLDTSMTQIGDNPPNCFWSKDLQSSPLDSNPCPACGFDAQHSGLKLRRVILNIFSEVDQMANPINRYEFLLFPDSGPAFVFQFIQPHAEFDCTYSGPLMDLSGITEYPCDSGGVSHAGCDVNFSVNVIPVF